MPVLVVSVPGQPDVVHTLGSDSVVVGRAPSSDVPIEDPKASGQHLRLAPMGGGWIVHDLGSTRGVRVGKRRVQRAVLTFGDTLIAGETRIRFLEKEPEPEPEDAAEPRVGGDAGLPGGQGNARRREGPGSAAAPSASSAAAASAGAGAGGGTGADRRHASHRRPVDEPRPGDPLRRAPDRRRRRAAARPQGPPR